MLKLYGVKVFTVDAMQGSEDDCTIFDLVFAFFLLVAYGHVQSCLRLDVALSRSRGVFMILIDRKALTPSDSHQRKLEKTSEDEREEQRLLKQEASKHLSKLLNYYEGKQVAKTVDANLYKEELEYVDMTPATEFMDEMEKRKMKGNCRNCGDPSHKSSECNKLRVFKDTCHKCTEKGHRTSGCPDIFCPKCNGEGHYVDKCTGPETRPCRNCNEVGHLKTDCKAPVCRRVRYTLPYEAAELRIRCD